MLMLRLMQGSGQDLLDSGEAQTDAKVIVRETGEGQQRGMLAWERASTTGFLKFWLLGDTAPPPGEC
jgi:hypothetical protein